MATFERAVLGAAFGLLTLAACQAGSAGPAGAGVRPVGLGGFVLEAVEPQAPTPPEAPRPRPPAQAPAAAAVPSSVGAGDAPRAPAASASTPTPSPTPSAAVPTPSPSPSEAPRRSGGGSSYRPPPPEPTPTPTPTPIPPPVLEPVSFTSTLGNPADPLKIDGVRLDPDFANNGELHLAFSVIGTDGTDLSASVDPARVRAEIAFRDEPPAPAPYRLRQVEAISVTVEALAANGRPPLDVLLTIDSTGSMAQTDPNGLRVGAAKAFIDQIRPSDEVAVMDFAVGLDTTTGLPDPLFVGLPDMRLLHAFSKDRTAAKAAVDQITAAGGTNLYDAIDQGIRYLAAQTSGRPRGLVALTDGQDNASSKTIEDVVAAADANDVLLMLLAFDAFDATAMNGLAGGSGGWFVGAEDPTMLEAQFGAAVRTLGGNAQAIIHVPQDQRVARHMAGRLTVTIGGQEYSGTFNVQQPGP